MSDSIGEHGKHWDAEGDVAELRAQRDDLLEALKAITERLEIALDKCGVSEPPDSLLGRARAAIAKAERKET